MRVVYLIITVICAVFYVLYKGDLSFVLLAFLIALPFVMHIILAIGTAFLKISVSCDTLITERGKPSAVKINTRNRSFIPVSSCMIKVLYTVSAPFETETPVLHTAAVPIGGGSRETLTLNFLPEHCGIVTVSVKNVYLRDLMGITRIKKKIGFSAKITVLPEILPMAAGIESSYVYNAESSSFSKEKAGDDPSEIFMLREYRDGDRHNLIHWKLSGRSDNFIVRELSKPVGSKILIITDFAGCRSAEETDRIFEAAAAVSYSLAENGTFHSLAFPYSDYTLRSAEIADTDGFYAGFAALCGDIKNLGFKSGAAYITEISDSSYIINGGFSRVIIVTEQDGGAYADGFAALCGEAKMTIICTCPEPKTDNGDAMTAADIIYADAEKLSEGKDNLFM